ncbi:unnamed protein product, partial [Symbiodinium natans]
MFGSEVLSRRESMVGYPPFMEALAELAQDAMQFVFGTEGETCAATSPSALESRLALPSHPVSSGATRGSRRRSSRSSRRSSRSSRIRNLEVQVARLEAEKAEFMSFFETFTEKALREQQDLKFEVQVLSARADLITQNMAVLEAFLAGPLA